MDWRSSWGFFKWLLWMSTFSFYGLPLALTLSIWAAWMVRKQNWLAIPALLPLVWIVPIGLSAMAVDNHSAEAKSASWTGWPALASLFVFLALTGFSAWKAKNYRWIALAVAGANVPMLLFSAFVVGMASSGDWL